MHAWAGVVKVEGEPFHSLDIDYKVDCVDRISIYADYLEIPRRSKCNSRSDGRI